MVDGRLPAVAADAVGETGMIKGCLSPIGRRMAGGALARKMYFWCILCVTVETVCEARMIEYYQSPIVRTCVAANAVANIMILRRVFGVAVKAVRDAGVVIADDLPVSGINMTGHAVAG